MVNGARQTGKSTLVQADEFEGRHYLTFDDVGVVAAARGDPSGFVAGLASKVTLDEIQHLPELFQSIKLAVDPGTWAVFIDWFGKRNGFAKAFRVARRPYGSADSLAVFTRGNPSESGDVCR
ncbi:MAG: AAA family ATPase [Chthoniobacterales bacterium]